MKLNRLLLLLSTLVMGVLLYQLSFHTMRAETLRVQAIFTMLFALYGALVFLVTKRNWQATLTDLFLAGLVLRMILLFSTPNLSDDFYRFQWDGYLINQGVSPYEMTPSQFMAKFPEDSMAKKLYSAHSDNFQSGMNSKTYYSVYPAVNQSFYAAAHWLSSGNQTGFLIVLKSFILLFECLTFFIFIRLLHLFDKARFLALLYWLNPLVIVEFMGNVHFEAVAIPFLLLAIYLIKRQHVLSSSLSLAMAVGTKLTPVFLSVVGLREMRFAKLLKWWVLTAFFVTLLLLTFMPPAHFSHFFESVLLYFGVFEFNSLFRPARMYLSYDAVANLKIILPTLTFAGIFSLNLLNKKWGISDRLILAYTLYFLFASTVHPWYILPLLPLAILSNWNYPLMWSYLVIWTYSFYQPHSVEQNLWIISAEYVVLIAFMVVDIRSHYRKGR